MSEEIQPVQQDGEVEIVEGFRRELHPLPTKKIAVLGTCPSRVLAPVGDPSWDIFTIGPGGKNSNRWDALFEIHTDGWPADFRVYLEELKAEKPPKRIFTLDPMPDWPANVLFPKEELYAKYGRMWFSSSIAYALAIALEEKATDIGVWGIDLESGEEYRSQYHGARYFLDLARLAGVNIHMPKGCGLLRDPIPYPDRFESHLGDTLKAKLDYLRNLVGGKRGQHAQLAAEINHIDGEIAAFDFIRNMYVLEGKNPIEKVPHIDHREMPLGQKMDILIGLLKGKLG